MHLTSTPAQSVIGVGSCLARHAVDVNAVEKYPVGTYAELLTTLAMLEAKFDLMLAHIALFNIAKIQSRWPSEFTYMGYFDAKAPPFEQLPREFSIKFISRPICADLPLAVRLCQDDAH